MPSTLHACGRTISPLTVPSPPGRVKERPRRAIGRTVSRVKLSSMKKLLAKRRDPAYRFGVEVLEGRTLLSATPSGTLLVQLTPGADAGLAGRLAAVGGATAAATGVPGLFAVSGGAEGLARVSAAAADDPG